MHLAAQQAVEALLEAKENVHAARVASMQHRVASLQAVIDAQKTEVRALLRLTLVLHRDRALAHHELLRV